MTIMFGTDDSDNAMETEIFIFSESLWYQEVSQSVICHLIILFGATTYTFLVLPNVYPCLTFILGVITPL